MLEVVKDLYIMKRKKWIRQLEDGTYAQLSYALHDDEIKKHLAGEQTIGVFSGDYFTNFICFDVDSNDKTIVSKLINCLKEKTNVISERHLLLSDSGSKGYHLELFFEQPVPFDEARRFYHSVLLLSGLNSKVVELRPTPKQGVKLPLSVNRKTGRKCRLLDLETFEPIEPQNIYRVRKIKWDKSWATDVALGFEEMATEVNFDVPIDYEDRVAQMLAQRRLLYPNSRHNSTLLLLSWLGGQGYDEEEAVELVQDVISNSRALINSDMSWAVGEVRRLWRYARNYKFDQRLPKEIKLYDTEIKQVLDAPNSNLLLSLLVHSKKWARKDGVFYMSYRQMTQMGNTSQRGSLQRYCKRLEELGYLEIVERNKEKKLPNKYRVNVHKGNSQNCITIEVDETPNLERITSFLLPESEVRQRVSRSVFYKRFKQHYYL